MFNVTNDSLTCFKLKGHLRGSSNLGQPSSILVSRPARHLLLLGDLVLDLCLLVELVEGVDNDGDGQGYDEDTADGTCGPTQLSKPGSE